MGYLLRTARFSRPGLSAVIALSVLLAGCSDGSAPATIDSYTTDSAGTTLTFDVVARPGAAVQAEVVTQDSSGVVVTVRTEDHPGIRGLLLVCRCAAKAVRSRSLRVGGRRPCA